ncbi:hypothetical protein HY408_01070 [Candidatus Gottesmanbacteria bacterium]|nr:hypothetical protein [Candidatus Gottesmanbacteria bacterium]
MKYLYFEDYSMFTFVLDQKGIEHGGKIIKVFATRDDPREVFLQSHLAVVMVDDGPLIDEDFEFPTRELSWRASQIEADLMDRTTQPLVREIARALLRFASLPETQFLISGMSLRDNTGHWVISHPLDEIDGWKLSDRGKEFMTSLHLDIFRPLSLESLRQMVNIDDPGQLVPLKEGNLYRKTQYDREMHFSRGNETF